MKPLLPFVICMALAPLAANAQVLKTLSLDDSSSIGLRLRTDTKVKVQGEASLRIETPWPTSVCLAEVPGPDVEAAQLLFGARVRTDLEGEAYLEMWVEVGGGQYFSRGLDDTVKGKSDWTSIRTPFAFQKGQRPSKVTLNLIVNGKGTVWVDEVVLSKAPLK